MIHFVLAAGAQGSCRSIGADLRRALQDTTSIGGLEVAEDSPSAAWSMRAIAVPDAFLSRRWHTEGESLVLCNGAVTGRSTETDMGAVLERYRTRGIGEAARPLTGTYNLVGIAPVHGLAVCGDVAGLYPLYHGTRDGVVVVSNRSTTVARALGRTGWDLAPLGWILGTGRICGVDVPAAGVRLVRPGHVGRAPWGTALFEETEPATHVFPGPDAGVGRDRLTSAEWDDVTEDLVEQARGLATLDVPLHLQLSGGMDSRLVLALLLAAGLTDVQTYTSGRPGDAEVRCAAAVAGTAGVAHRCGLPPGASIPVRREVRHPIAVRGGDADLWHEVATGVGRFDGAVATWASIRTPQAPASLMVKGWGGEIYRFKSRSVALEEVLALLPLRDEASIAALAGHFASRVDPLRLLRRAERARQVAWLGDWVRRTAASVRPDLLPDVFYLHQHMGNFNGPVTQGLPLRVVSNPVVSFGALQRYAELSLPARSVDRLHYEVMRRAAPALVPVPFVDRVWHPAIHESSPRELPTTTFAPAAPRVPPRRRPHLLPRGEAAVLTTARDLKHRAEWRARVDWLAGSRWSPPVRQSRDAAWALVQRRPTEVTALLRDAADAGLADICRVDRLCRIVGRPGALTPTEQSQVTSAIGVALVLAGRTEQVVETAESPVPDREELVAIPR